MREIKFRGKQAYDKEWTYGWLLKDAPNATAYYREFPYRITWYREDGAHCNSPVVTETVGRDTGRGGWRGVFPVDGNVTTADVECIGNTNPSGNGMNGNVFDSEGLAPTLTTNKGEGSRIMVKQVGNLIDTDSFGGNPHRGQVYAADGISPCLSTMQGGGLEPKIVIKQATKQGFIEVEEGGVFDMSYPDSETRRGRVQDGGKVTPTVTANSQLGTLQNFRIRKLTPKECFRLQGFPDEYFERAKSVNSNSQLYKQAGNSVTVNVIYEIARRLE